MFFVPERPESRDARNDLIFSIGLAQGRIATSVAFRRKLPQGRESLSSPSPSMGLISVESRQCALEAPPP
jgi:hypothetical protein